MRDLDSCLICFAVMPASLDTNNLCIAIVNHACACSKLAERCCLQIERARHIGFTPTHLQQSTSILVMPISCGSIKHTIHIKRVGCRVPGGPRLDDLFVTTVKTFWQVWLNPLYTQFALDFAAHASMSHGACLHLKQCYASLCAYLFFPKNLCVQILHPVLCHHCCMMMLAAHVLTDHV